ncbi:MAG: hypothetical protein ACOYH4_06420 [Saccharofermentanales bacterium]|jgi:hypothetical protein
MNTLADLITDTLFLSDTVSTQYLHEDIVRNINIHYDDAVLLAWKSDNYWKFDEGVDKLPIAYTDIHKGQTDYQIPSAARRIDRIEIILPSGQRKELSPTTIESIKTHDEAQGTPTHYYIKGASIYLFPTPDYDLEEALEIYLSRSVTRLKEGTDEVRFPRELIRYITLGAASDFYFSKGSMTKFDKAERQKAIYELKIKDHFSARHQGIKSKMVTKRERYN